MPAISKSFRDTSSIVRELLKEGVPTRIVNGLRQHATRQPFNIQVLDRNHAEPVHQLAAGIVVECGALITDSTVRFGYEHADLATPIASPFATGKSALCAPQMSESASELSGILYLRTIGEHRELVQSNIDTYHLRQRVGQRNGFALDGEAHIPVVDVPLDLVRGVTIQPVHNFGQAQRRLQEQVNAIRHHFQRVYRDAKFLGFLLEKRLQAAVHRLRLEQHRAAVSGAPHDVILQAEYRARVLRVPFHCINSVFGGGLIRGSNRGCGTFSTASLFRCRMNAIPEA